jgi:hypothetical protein
VSHKEFIMKRIRWAARIVVVLLAAASVEAAEVAPADKPYIEPCKADVQRFCQSFDPGDERIIGCLKEHREEVSDSCKARLAQMRVRTKPGTPKGQAPVTGK